MRKIKKGDKVKIPKTKQGEKFDKSNSELKDYKLDYLMVDEVHRDNNIGLERDDNGNFLTNSFYESDLELYEEKLEIPTEWCVIVGNGNDGIFNPNHPVIEYLNKTYNRNHDGSAMYYGVKNGKSTYNVKSEGPFGKLLTLEEFEKQNFKPKFQILSYYAKNISGKGDYHVDPTYIWKEKSPGLWARWDGDEFCTSPYNQEQITNHNGYGIHSIKRLSDGEVFTVGDKTELGIILAFDKPGLVYGLVGNEFCIDYRYKIDDSGYGWRMLDQAIKSKTPLLTTEDGIDLFEGDEYYTVFIKDETNITGYNTYGPHKLDTLDKNKTICKYFKTKQKAEEFIENNKKKYSIEDIKKVFKDNYYCIPTYYGIPTWLETELKKLYGTLL